MTLERTKKHKLLSSYFITYLIVLIIPLLTVLILYRESVRIIREETDSANRTIMRQASDILDTQLADIRSTGLQIIDNTSLLSLQYLENPLAYPGIQQVYQVKSTLQDYTVYNDLIYDYFLFFDRGQLVLNDRIAYSYSDFSKNYMHPADNEGTDWLIRSDFSTSVGRIYPISVELTAGGQNKSIDLLGFVFAFQPYGNGESRLVLFVERQNLVSLLESFGLEEGDIAYIEIGSGELAAWIGGDEASIAQLQQRFSAIESGAELVSETINGEGMLVSAHASGNSSYRILIARNASRVYARLRGYRLLIIISAAASLLVAVLLAIMFSRKNSRLVRTLAPANSDTLEGLSYGDAFRSLGVLFDDMRASNYHMADALEKQKPYLLRSFLTQLLNGDFRTEEEAEAIADSISSLDPAKGLCVIFFRYTGCETDRGAESLQLALSCRTIIRMTIESTESSCLHTERLDEDYVLLMPAEQLEERLDRLATEIRSKLPEEANRRLCITAGNIVYKLTDVVRSLDNALSLVYIHPPTSEIPVLYYVESSNERARIFYPQDLQHHLISCIMSGDEPGMLALLSELKEKNLQGACIPSFMRQLFIDSLLNTLLQAVNMVGFPADKIQHVYDRVKALMTLPVNNQLSEIDVLFISLCSSVVQMKNTRQQIAIDDVCDYIRNNYTDVNLSLTSVADRFGISESYLSGTFKAQSGANFFTYVEMLRINKAKELLRNTNLKIGEIAEQVGYASANSFCRAFRRSTNSNATDYRNGTD